ncbi:MAG: hypothetical protein ACO2PP_12565 [Thermocrinis sp.]|jgi:hypothetical protein|uniref:hypothetical protein n=1 Tax=Thermocrinis sp. TaxID=2024383 RepID=UPI003BFA8CD2
MAIINRRMQEYRIATFADLMQALRENPEWLRKLRRTILTQELLPLPSKFGKFRRSVKEKFNTIEEQMRDLREKMDALEKRLQEVEKKVDEIKKRLDMDVCFLKGMWVEAEVKKNVHPLFSEHLSNVKLVGKKRINKILSLPMEKGTISKEEREDVLRLDLIVEGTLISTKEPVFVAVEASYTIDEADVQRAIRRAEILKKAADRKVLPAVVGYRISKKAEKLIAKEECLKVLISEQV